MAPPHLISVTLGLSVVLFAGYCVYFDRKRRSSPDYRKRVHERRRKLNPTPPPMGETEMENAPENFFLNQMRVGELLIAQGHVDEGLTHFATAVALCSVPDKVLEVLQATMPPNMFRILVTKLKNLHIMSDSATSMCSGDMTSSSGMALGSS